MTCFLCLNNLSSFDGSSEDEKQDKTLNCEKVSLAAINNYLNLRDNLQPYNNSENDDKGPQVFMCLDCETVASRLTNLCTQLEEIKLKISYSLKQFVSKLEKAKEDVENNGLEEELLTRRHNYRTKCKRELENFPQPVIKIDKLKMVKVTMKNEPVFLDDENGYDDIEMNEASISDQEQEQQQLEENVFEVKASSIKVDLDINWEESSKSTKQRPRQTKKRRGIDKEGNFVCTTCNLKFPSLWERRQHTRIHQNARKLKEANFICTKCDNHQMFKEAIGLRRHNMLFHLETLFPDSRIEGISQAQFSDYCKHVLHVEGLLSKRPNSSGYQCQHCKHNNLYLTTYLCLKKHLFKKHKAILDQKLEDLQKTTGPEELKQVVLPPVRDNKKCGDCGATFSQAESLNRHLRQSCPFRKNKDVSAARPCQCQECGARYSGTAAFYRHRKDKHPNSTRDPLFV